MSSFPTTSTAGASGAISVMLAINEKKTTPTDLYRPLRNYVCYHYSEREAQNLEDDLDSVRQMRSQLEAAAAPPSPDVRRDTLISYFRALCAVEARFPISPNRDHVNTLTFTWYDAFKPSKKASQQNIHLEKAAVLFNLGAVYSQIALSSDRNNAPGLKQACNSFQSAAGAFAYLRDNASIKASVGSSATLDISAECAGMLERLMLAQAQECFFEKAVGDAKPPGLCSKVARQVALFYEEAYAALNSPPLNQHFERAWISHVQMKAAQYYAEACHKASLELHQKEDIAEEIARLKSGIAALADAKKSTKGVAAPLQDAVAKLESKMNTNLERAVKENDRVYLLRVPSLDSLGMLPAASLVKPTPMGEVFDASKERLFSSLVPDSSAKALSRYTEMVDEIIRIQAEKLQQGSEITRVKLKEMDLPDSILALEGNFSMPVDLKEDVEAVQVVGGPSGLDAELQQLRDLRRVNQEMLVQTEELLQKEEREDSQFRTQFGARWTRPQSTTLTKNLLDRLNRFAANLKQAADSDARIERALNDHAALLSILDHRPIESSLPSLGRPMMSLDGNEDAIVGALKQSLRQLENLGAQRAGLEDMLKEMKRKDDILPKLMATTGSYEDLFKKEISKYDHICEEIAQNIEAQEQLLIQIQDQNEHFSAVFNLEDYKVSREKAYKQIAAAVAKFREIKENVNEGLKFYVTLQDAITNVKQQCSDFVMTRNMQCREMIEDVQRQMAGLSFSSDRKPSYNYSASGQSNPSEGTARPADGHNVPRPSYSPPPYSQSPMEPSRTTYSQQGYAPYGAQRPPYHMPSGGGSYQASQQPPNPYQQPQQPPNPYQQPQQPPNPYQQPQQLHNPYQQPQQPSSYEHGQPTYSGWHGPSYGSSQQHSSFQPRPPYTVQGPYAPNQGGGYYQPPQ